MIKEDQASSPSNDLAPPPSPTLPPPPLPASYLAGLAEEGWEKEIACSRGMGEGGGGGAKSCDGEKA